MPDAELKPRFDDVLALGPHGFTRVAYAEWGDPDAEQVVICVHGLTRNCRDFDFLARRLAHRGLRVIAPDLPGRGKSQWVTPPTDYATPLYMAAIEPFRRFVVSTRLNAVRGSSCNGCQHPPTRN